MVTSLELRLLGGFELRDGGGRIVTISTRKNKALLAVLALAPAASIPRERAMRLLWSDRGQTQAQSSVRQSLVALRKDLAEVGAPAVLIEDDRLMLDRNHIKIDAVEFQRLAASSETDALRRAIALYRDELLAGFDVNDTAFERWLASERQRHADMAITALEKLCQRETGETRLDYAKHLVALDPVREASHRILMSAYADAGEKGLAIRQYDVCRAALKDELGVAAGEETEALRQRLMSDMLLANGSPHPALQPRVEQRPASDDKPSIAVLPFNAMGQEAGLDDFCDGLTEDIITGLSRVKAIRVIGRNIMFTFKGRAVDTRTVGSDLGVRYVLEGSIRKSGSRMRVTAQLIAAQTGHHIWAEKFDRENSDTFELQDAMTSSIVASTQTQIILNEGKLASEEPAENATRLLARSWQQFVGLTEQSLSECRSLAERALAFEPDNPLGHRLIATALYHQVYMGFAPWTRQIVEQSYSHAVHAIEASGADEFCHWAMACAHLLRGEHDRALASLNRALNINPHCSIAHGSIGTVLAWAGDTATSIRNNEMAVRMNPDDPTIFFRYFGLSLAHYLAGRYEKALEFASMVVQSRPNWWLGLTLTAASLGQLGRTKEAAKSMDELRRVRRSLQPSSFELLPFAQERDRDLLLEGLQQAGLEIAQTPLVLIRQASAQF